MNTAAAAGAVDLIEAVGAGQCFFVPTGEKDHLFVCVFGTKNVPNSGEVVLLVPFCTVPTDGAPYDHTCLIQKGEHSFVTRLTYVDYRYARVELAADVLKYASTGYFRRMDDVTAELLQRIADGIRVTRRIPRFIPREWP